MSYTRERFERVLAAHGFRLARVGKHRVWRRGHERVTTNQAPPSFKKAMPSWRVRAVLRGLGIEHG